MAGFYTVRILRLSRARGRSPVFGGRPGSLHFLTHMTFRIMRALIWVVCVARLVAPEIDPYLGPITALWHPAVLLAGCALLVVSFAFVVFVHFAMGAAWRSGTAEDETVPLVTTGPFGRSRNPMMLGVQAAQVGLFLAMPSVFTLACLLIGIAAVQVQVRLEEDILARQHGAAYATYRAETARWLGF